MKKSIRLNEEELRTTIREIIMEELGKQRSLELVNITDQSEIDSYIDIVYDMLVKTYENLGGFFGASNKDILQGKTSLMTLYTNGFHIYSAGVYSFLHGGKKLFGVAHDGTKIGRNGIHLIIKRDITEWKNWYWCEASGAVAHLYEKYGAFKMPSIYASEILGIEGIIPKDEYTYERSIAGHPCEKTIFGYRDEEIYNKVNAEREKEISIDYAELQTDKMNEAITDENKRWENKVKLACHIIGAISDNVSEWRAYDLTPNQHQALKDCIKILEKEPENKIAQQAIRLGQYMLKNYPISELHKF